MYISVHYKCNTHMCFFQNCTTKKYTIILDVFVRWCNCKGGIKSRVGCQKTHIGGIVRYHKLYIVYVRGVIEIKYIVRNEGIMHSEQIHRQILIDALFVLFFTGRLVQCSVFQWVFVWVHVQKNKIKIEKPFRFRPHLLQIQIYTDLDVWRDVWHCSAPNVWIKSAR